MDRREYLLKKQREMADLKDKCVALRYAWTEDMVLLMKEASTISKKDREKFNRQKLYNILGGLNRDDVWIETTIVCMKTLIEYYQTERSLFNKVIKRAGKSLAIS